MNAQSIQCLAQKTLQSIIQSGDISCKIQVNLKSHLEYIDDF